MSITPPTVLFREDPVTGKQLEPYEQVDIDTDLHFISGIIDKMNERKGVLLELIEQKDGRQLATFKVPTRGLLGFRNYLTTATKGTA